ncbi:hypothetical protein SDRG_15959 [Saprolegnia diclina VS20]|uniref:U2A'/phosphoprotein 32 family A C-terminal domain-containing protein n=1 Tax=Saprolegnia diclina (strain VS20) TaxID=1156394 RepID=T0R2G9_SAPDV|nr:hypothetical protein SDRG_15959 [Saprolegnia diclina VS20]EQC26223.1 hypothetical protein SDRG_15959 [Saprolegnia diclina VS20]|eukprot:XP_008620368.1 hypothetical protein SDRG_15959 [Saprolegnia diclina VS20]
MRVSEPHKELAVSNEKYVKNCTELVLAHREIDVLGNFEPFVSLEVLWINDNYIEKLTGLDTCFRIKYLFAQNNRISTVDGSLLHFTFLRELRLFNNRLQDLHATLRTLSKLLHLHDLDLFGNPLAEEENYRLHVIAAIPSLEVFDRHVITPDERLAAKKLNLRRPGHTAKANNNHQLTKEPQPHEWSGTVKMLMKEVSVIERRHKAQEEAERKKQFQMTDASFTSQTNASNRAIAIAQNATVMDEWDLCHLRKAFRAADPHKRGGIFATLLGHIISEMLDHGQQLVFNDNVLHEESNFTELLAHVTRPMTAAEIDQEDVDPPTTSLVTWALFSQGFTQGFVGPSKIPLRWQPLPAADVALRADEYFEKSRALQKRMMSMAEPKPDLIKQMHELSQKAYHLQSLRDQRSSGRSSFAHIAAAEAKSPARDAITVFSYTKVCPSKGEKDADQDDPSQLLAKKYAIKDKDFQTYLKAKDARRPVKVTKDVLTM